MNPLEKTLGRLALYTTFYPQMLPFVREWADSVRQQTDRDFDLWIGVDGISISELPVNLALGSRVTWVESDGRGPGAGIRVRIEAIQRMVRHYDGIVFVDSDDILFPDRLARARQDLERFDLAGCALEVVDREGAAVGRRFGVVETGLGLDGMLSDYNIFGLSNTAYRAACLARCLPVPEDCELMDWFLATRAWMLGFRLGFDSQPGMYYRQYGENTAIVLPPFAPEVILRASRRVAHHYDCVLRGSEEIRHPFRHRLENRRNEVRGFLAIIENSREILESYARALAGLPVQNVWWWSVAHPELKHLWKN